MKVGKLAIAAVAAEAWEPLLPELLEVGRAVDTIFNVLADAPSELGDGFA